MLFFEASISGEGNEAIIPILIAFLDEVVVVQIWPIVLKVKMHYDLCNQRLVCKRWP
jgi:hypothetical protein